jgi:hypothetical protein
LPTRREVIRNASTALLGLAASPVLAQVPGERPSRSLEVEILNPRARVPLSIIIDDSTCLVNLNRFAIPQFSAAFSFQRYHHDWRSMPHEIPDHFVRRFAEWAEDNGVKGKYSIVPYPACVGRLDGELPGWSSLEVKRSIQLVRDLVSRNWDIHPEMVTHTRVIDIKTGHPYPERSPRFMENWEWTDGKSVDEIAAYMRYALQILHHIELPCEGITTPGGFGVKVLPEIAQATLQACQDVYQTEIPHYFRHLFTDDRSVAPRVEYASGIGGPDPKCVVSIIGCTGDWTGGWDCSSLPQPDRFITPDLTAGRLVDVIARDEPAILVCHWTGVYYNGRELGFKTFQEVVRRLHAKYDNLIWMKNSEIARYWAAKELTAAEITGGRVKLNAPFPCPAFTLRYSSETAKPPVVVHGGNQTPLREVAGPLKLEPGTWTRSANQTTICFNLQKGISEVT